MSKKKKIKSRRSFSRAEAFPKKEAKEVLLKDWLIRQAIPDPEERQEYIRALIKGLETEPFVEAEEFERNKNG